jgi:hypothetical protein
MCQIQGQVVHKVTKEARKGATPDALALGGCIKPLSFSAIGAAFKPGTRATQ